MIRLSTHNFVFFMTQLHISPENWFCALEVRFFLERQKVVYFSEMARHSRHFCCPSRQSNANLEIRLERDLFFLGIKVVEQSKFTCPEYLCFSTFQSSQIRKAKRKNPTGDSIEHLSIYCRRKSLTTSHQ